VPALREMVAEPVGETGVVEDPDGKEGSGQGGWFYRFGEADVPAWDVLSTQQALAAEALLLGRRTDTWFGTRERPGAWADRTLAMPNSFR